MNNNTNELSDRAFRVGNVLFCALFSLLCIFPFYYVFINTISNNELVAAGKILFWPQGLHLNNYIQVAQIKGIFSATLVSVARTVIGTVTSVLACAFLGYALSKKEFFMRGFWYRYFIITMYFNAGLIPWYLNMKFWGLTNNFWGYILPMVISPFNMILVKTYIESIPPSLEESAELDGAGYLKRFFSIVMPLSKPILATIAVFTAVTQWNSFMDTVMLMNKGKFYTLQYILYKYLNEVNSLAEMMKRNPSFVNMSSAHQLTPVAVRFTITVVTVLPILLVYPFFQRYFVKGIMIGAVKG